jgi:hypothetical protein
MSSRRFCMYCRCDKPLAGFRDIVDPAYKTKRGQCKDCTDKRNLPRAELEKLAKSEGEARRAQLRTAARDSADKRRKNEQ